MGAIFLLIITLAGTTLGPLIPGLFNDYLFSDEHAIGKSLQLTALGFGVASAFCFWITLPDYRKQHRLAQQLARRGDD